MCVCVSPSSSLLPPFFCVHLRPSTHEQFTFCKTFIQLDGAILKVLEHTHTQHRLKWRHSVVLSLVPGQLQANRRHETYTHTHINSCSAWNAPNCVHFIQKKSLHFKVSILLRERFVCEDNRKLLFSCIQFQPVPFSSCLETSFGCVIFVLDHVFVFVSLKNFSFWPKPVRPSSSFSSSSNFIRHFKLYIITSDLLIDCNWLDSQSRPQSQGYHIK